MLLHRMLCPPPCLHAIHSALPQLRDRLLGFLVEQVRRGVQTTIMYSGGW